jgi:ankyrin repeat protein
VVRELLKRGADPNLKNKLDGTPLMFAAANGHLDVVRELVAGGADIAIKDSQGRTARMWAEKGGFTEVANFLRNAGEAKV